MKNRAKSCFFDTTALVDAPPGDTSYLIGAGSVFSTPADLRAMQRSLISGKFGKLASGAIDRVRKAVPAIAAGADVPVPEAINAAPFDVEVSTLKQYEGLHELQPGRNLELHVTDGRVTMDDWLLIPVGKSTLFSAQD